MCQLQSGELWNLMDPDPDDVNIEDIAHALAHICRFNGHTRQFYSVAEHSVRVAAHLAPDWSLQVGGLLHDASEAYLGDVIRPLKPLCIGYAELEDKTIAVIMEGLGLARLVNMGHPAIKEADTVLLATEARDLMFAGAWNRAAPDLYTPNFFAKALPEPIVPWSSEEARRRFLDAYHYLIDAYEHHMIDIAAGGGDR